MKFQKYNSIENIGRQREIDAIFYSGLNGGMWTASEKIHGANMSMWYDGQEMRVAKRSGFFNHLSPKAFYSFDYVEFNEYLPKMQKLYKLCEDMFVTPLDIITVCGEWFGGGYPHQDVPKSPQASRVQRGIFYSPKNEFSAFDLKIGERYVDVDIYEPLLIEAGFSVCETFFRGTFEDCLELSNEFETTIPEKYGLPKIEDNICEGIVIKPNEAKFLSTGSRVILKSKNARHSEKEPRQPRTKNPLSPLGPRASSLFQELLSFLNENRLRNVLSHIGPVNNKMFGKVQGLFVQDALNELKKDKGKYLKSLSKEELKSVLKRAQIEASLIVRENFLNILDGNF